MPDVSGTGRRRIEQWTVGVILRSFFLSAEGALSFFDLDRDNVIMQRLTAKQEKYIELVAGGMSQRQAYKEAYDCRRMTDKSVDELASRLMKKVKVASRFNELCASAIKASEDNAVTMRAKLIKGWKKIEAANIMDYLTVDKDGTVKIRNDLKKLDCYAIKSIRLTNTGQVAAIELYGRDHAMDKLQELYGIGAQEDTDNRITVRFDDGMEDMTV
jgi:hypothetical protein